MTTLAFSLLPAEHVHETDSGALLVHRHVINDAPEHAGSIEHGDHDGVTVLVQTFVGQRQYDIDRPLIRVELDLVAPDYHVMGRVEPIDAVMTHGPPIRPVSLRAPPV